MVAIRLDAYVDENGEIRVHVPDDFPRDQPVELEIRVKPEASTSVELPPEEEAELDKDIQESLEIIRQGGENRTGAEIAAWILEHGGGWEHKGISDSVEWLAEQRRQSRARRLDDDV